MMEKQSTTYYLDGLCCAEEERLVEKKLCMLSGVETVASNILSRTTVITHTCSRDVLVHALREIGFPPRLYVQRDEPGSRSKHNAQFWFTMISGFFLACGLILKSIDAEPQAWIPLVVVSMIAGGWHIAIKTAKGIRHGSLDMNVLMTSAAVGAAAIGQWAEGAAVIVLFSISHVLESYSMDRARKAIRSLLELSPPTATVLRESVEASMEVDQIQIGERVIVRPGERIPVDGIVVEGESAVNQTTITGESGSISKKSRDSVYAGTVNEYGVLVIEVSKHHEDTTLANIIRLVESTQTARAPIQQFAETFARYYSPAVIGIAIILVSVAPIITGDPFSVWFYRALVMLVIACPCALVISTPVALLSGLSNAARQGILLKGGRYLEEIGRVNAIAFDKTGTLTEGNLRVTDVIPMNSLSREEIVRLTASIESGSEHHLADAVIQMARNSNIVLDGVRPLRFETIAGRGVTAGINGTTYFVGNHALIEEQGICTPAVESVLDQIESEGKTGVILGTATEVLGIIAVSDTPRVKSASVVRKLYKQGIKKVVMLSGDNQGVAQTMGRQIGIDDVYANVLPQDKAHHIKQLKQAYGRVAMVGDGINDAPALAASDIGIAMGGSGTDVTLETADIVLMSDDLAKIPYIISLSRKTRSLIKQNIAIALVTKLVFLGLGIAGITSLWLAVLADDGATVLVITNSLRALRKLKE